MMRVTQRVHIVDHVFVLLLVLVQPIHGAMAYRRFLGRIRAGLVPNRVRLYAEIMVIEWMALAVLLLAWSTLSRPVADLGLVVPQGIGFWTGVVVVLLLAAVLYRSWRKAGAMAEADKARQRALLGDLVQFLPTTDRHFRYFTGLSVTAGIVEEVVYRGFLLWYLTLYTPLWAAVVLSSAAFGLGHSYQGVAGVIKTLVVGAAFAIMYVATGSVWLPIVAHIVVDLLQGATILALLRQSPAPGPSTG